MIGVTWVSVLYWPWTGKSRRFTDRPIHISAVYS